MFYTFEFELGYINEVLTEYYRKKYNSDNIKCECYTYSYLKKGIGWDDSDEYQTNYGLKAMLKTGVNSVAFGKKLSLNDYLLVEEDELDPILTEIFNKKLDEEGNGFEVFYIKTCDNMVAVIVSKEKVLKKSNNMIQ